MVILFSCFEWISLKHRIWSLNLSIYLSISTVTATGLTYVMGQRYMETSKIMPAGIIAMIRYLERVLCYSVLLSALVAWLPCILMVFTSRKDSSRNLKEPWMILHHFTNINMLVILNFWQLVIFTLICITFKVSIDFVWPTLLYC